MPEFSNSSPSSARELDSFSSPSVTEASLTEDLDSPVQVASSGAVSKRQKTSDGYVNRDLERDESEYGLVGVISKVNVINFMCHENLSIDLGPKINFIIGQNGSGKSAVITAISLCLGGSAANTQRATNLKSFIREGCDKAVVRVVLRNESSKSDLPRRRSQDSADSADSSVDAIDDSSAEDEEDINTFRHQHYGDSITIERHISKDGSSSYKLKSEFGKVISTKREELDNILSKFSIFVDNKFAILTQESSRSYLTASSGHAKYKHFMQGVLLDDINLDYENMQLNCDRTQQLLKEKSSRLDELSKIRDHAKKLYNIVKSKNTIQEEKQRLAGVFAWAFVEKFEKEVEKFKDKLTQKENLKDQALKDIEGLRVKSNEIEAKHQKIAERIDDFPASREPFQRAHEHSQSKIRDLDAELKSLQRDERQISDQIKITTNDIDTLRKEIEIEVAKLEGGFDEERRQLKAKLETVHGKIDKVDKDIEISTKEVEDLENQVQNAPSDAIALKNRLTYLDRNVSDQRQQVRELRNSQSQYMSVFGRGISELLKEINSDTRFAAKPVGPLGCHIKLKKPEWSPVLEYVLGNSLTAFAVSSYQDKEILQNIFRKHRYSAGIIVSPEDNFSYEARMPDRSRFLTLLDALEIDNDHVKRILINLHQVERTILIANRAEADRQMHSKPSNVHSCISLNANNPQNGFRLSTEGGSSRTQPVYGWRGAPRMKTNTDYQIDSILKQLELDQEESRKLTAQLNEAQSARRALITRTDRKKSLLASYRKAKQEFEAEIDTIEEKLREEVDSSHLEELQISCGNSEEKLEGYEGQLAELIENRNSLKDSKQGLFEAARKAEKDLSKVQLKLLELEKQQQKIIEMLKDNEKDIDNKRISTEKIDVDIAKLENLINEAQRRYDTSFKQASEISEERLPMEDGMTIEMLQKELAILQSRDEEIQRLSELSFDQAQLQLNKANDNYDKAQLEYNALLGVNEQLVTAYNRRKKRHEQFVRKITRATKDQFMFILSQRGFEGKLLIDHKTRKLEIEASPIDSAEQTRRNVKTMSGGEKSFSQVALLLAVWKTMRSRIRALDEFDVFMDSVNRKISMGLMIDAIRESEDAQTIFITPQDIGDMTFSSDVKIHRMHDPKR